MLKKFLRSIYRAIFTKPIREQFLQRECTLARQWVASAHRRLMIVQWSLPPEPEHYDHHIDLYYQWLTTRKSYWVERGVLSGLALQGGDVLEIACGDGFNARNFYSLRSRRVIACDFDPAAIQTARRKNSAPNITYVLADIRIDMPEGVFDNIIWDAAIEHFTPQEIDQIMKTLKTRLSMNGILSGYTLVERSDKQKWLSHHEYEFRNKEDLFRFFTPYFQHVSVFETIHPERHNLYFWASDGVLPFHENWPHLIRQ